MPERIGRGLAAALLLAVFASALGVIHLKHRERSLIAQLSRLQHEHDRLDSEWSRLLLEEATLTTHARVESKAREQLHMVRRRRRKSFRVRR